MSYFSQMLGLTVQNFLSAGVGIAVAVALIRGIVGRSGREIGNFCFDLTRTVLWVLTPISFVVAILLVFQGVIDNFSHYLSFSGSRICRSRSRWARSPAGGDQGVGDQRRRLLQHQLRPPVREPDRLHELRRNAHGARDPGGTRVHVRADGRQPPPGVRDLRDDDGDVPRRGLVAYIAEAHGSPAQHAAGLHTGVIPARAAATWRVRSSASGSRARPCST